MILVYRMELIVEAKLMIEPRVASLVKEADELTAISVASRKTASQNLNRKY